MTIQWGDTGRVRFGALKTLNISPYVNEQNITSTALPTGSSSTLPNGINPAVSYTINTSTMTPTFSGVNVLSYKPVYGINVSGQNTNGASQTLYYQINKNGVSYKTGNASVANNNYFTVTMCDGTFVNGDKIDVYIWTPATTGMNYFYSNIFCQPSRVDTGAKNIVNITFSPADLATNTYFPLTGKIGQKNRANNFINYWSSSSYMGSLPTSGVTTIPLAQINSTYKLYFLQAGDNSGTYCDIATSTTNYPQLDCNYQITSISYRDLFF